MELKQIYDIQNLKLRFKDKKALEIKTLKFHNGLIYGICGNFGSGKTSLLKILAGELKEHSTETNHRNKSEKSSKNRVREMFALLGPLAKNLENQQTIGCEI